MRRLSPGATAAAAALLAVVTAGPLAAQPRTAAPAASAASALTRSLLLDGTGGATGPSIALSGTAATFEAYVRPDARPASGTVSIAGIATSGAFWLRMNPSGTVTALVSTSGGLTAPTSATALPTGTWSHVAVVYTGSAVNLYVNGALSGSATFTGNLTASGAILMGTGADGKLTGAVDEVRLWTVARTATEIATTRNVALASNTANMAGYWRMDAFEALGAGAQGSNDVRDFSGNARHADVTGGTIAMLGSPVDDVAADPAPGASIVRATTDQHEDRIVVRWPAATTAGAQVRIERSGVPLTTVARTDSLFTDRAARPFTSTRYCVVQNVAGRDAVLGCATGRTRAAPAQGVVATDRTRRDGVAVVWTNRATTATGVRLVRVAGTDTTGFAARAALADLPATAASTLDATAVVGTAYTYCVVPTRPFGGLAVNIGPAVCDPGMRGSISPAVAVAATDGLYPTRTAITWADADTLDATFKITRGGTLLTTVSQTYTTRPKAPKTDFRYDDLTGVRGTVYTYCVVRSIGGADAEPVCNDGSFGTLAAATAVAATDGTFDDRVEVGWRDRATGESAYHVFRMTGAVPATPDTTAMTRIGAAAANAEAFTDLTALPGVAYAYCVVARTEFGATSPLACDAGRRAIVLPPSTVVASDSTFENRVVVTWKRQATRASVIRVYRGGVLIESLPETATRFEDAGTGSNVRTQYCVAAVTAADEESNWACDFGTRLLNAPVGVVATDNDQTESRTQVTWVDASAFERGYLVYRRLVNANGTLAADSALAGRTVRNAVTFSDRGGAPTTRYRYAVVAFDSLAGPGRTTSGAGLDMGARTLAAPTVVDASEGTSETQVIVTWEDNATAETGFRIYREAASNTGTPAYTLAGTAARNATSFIDTGMPLGIQQRYSVVAIDALGEGTPSTTTIGFTTLLPPSSVSASTTYTNGVTVTWSIDSQTLTSQSIWRDGVLLGGQTATSVRFTDGSAVVGTLYTYCVQSHGPFSTSTQSCATGQRAPTPAAASTTVAPTATIAPAVNAEGLGRSIAASSQWLVIGAPQETNGTGAVYVYTRGAQGWEQDAKIVAQDAQRGDSLGLSVAIDGDYLVVGAPFADPTYSNEGAAYVFERGASGWRQTSKLTYPASDDNSFTNGVGTAVIISPSGRVGMRFGAAVAITGEHIVVGAPDAVRGVGNIKEGAPNFWGQSKGTSMTFGRQTNGGWLATQNMQLPYDSDDAAFGSSVGAFGTWMIFGSPNGTLTRNNTSSTRTGHVSILRRTASATQPWEWQHDHFVGGAPATEVARYGTSVALSDGWALVGAPAASSGAGRAYVLRIGTTNNNWSAVQTLSPQTGGTGFGLSVALSGGDALVAQTSPRRVDVYSLVGSTWTYQRSIAPTVTDGGFGAVVDVSNGQAYIGTSATAAKKAYVLETRPAAAGAVMASDAGYESHVKVEWKDLADTETGYRVYRDGTLVQTLGQNETSYEDASAQNGVVHRYCVAAYDGAYNAESDPACSFGWRKPDGAVSGVLTMPGGREGVASAQVCLAPSPNRSLLLDGLAGRAVTPDSLRLPGSFTIEYWARRTDRSRSEEYVIGLGTGSTTRQHPHMGFRGANASFDFWNDAIDFPDGGTLAWHHYAVTFDSTSRVLETYRNGVDVGGKTFGISPVLSKRPVYIGNRSDGTGYLQGGIDELRVWRGVRTPAQIAANMTRTVDPASSGLVAYWRFDETGGRGTASLAGGAGAVNAALEGGSYQATGGAPVSVCATTDSEGKYTIDGIRYGETGTFRVQPSKDGREFSPAVSSVTLSRQSPVQNSVGFIDATSFGITGLVTTAASAFGQCRIEGAQLLVDGQIRERSDAEGTFSLGADPGRRVIAAQGDGLTFSPANYTFNVRQDTSNVNFTLTTTRSLSGRVGGSCNFGVGTVTLEVKATNGCYTRDVTTAANGAFSVSLPPLAYSVRVKSITGVPNPALEASIRQFYDDMGSLAVDLTARDTVLNLLYRAPLDVAISGLPANDATLGVPVMKGGRGDSTVVTFSLRENYGSGNFCPVDATEIAVADEISDRAATAVVVPIKKGVGVYTVKPGLPSLLTPRLVGGVDRSYQKFLIASASLGGRTATATAWAVVEGNAPRPGLLFTTAVTDMPIDVLRDPPGDGSSTTVEEGSQFCRTITYEVNNTSGLHTEGFFVGGPAEVFMGGIHGVFNLDWSTVDGSETTTCLTTTKTISTSDSDAFVGPDADVFLGAGVAYRFGTADRLRVVDGAVALDQLLTIAPSYKSTYLYTRAQVRDYVIPRLQALAAAPATDPQVALASLNSVATWNKILAYTDSLAGVAPMVIEGLSFTGGAGYEYHTVTDSTVTTSTTDVFTREFEIGLHFEGEGGFIFTAIKFELHLRYHSLYEETNGTSDDSTYTRDIGFVLADDDVGDDFSLNVRKDPVFGTPVFDVLAGASSLPYEPWIGVNPTTNQVGPLVTPRDLARIGVTGSPVQTGVAPGAVAAFPLEIVNASPTAEGRDYRVRVLNASNGRGAVLTINGAPAYEGVLFNNLTANQSYAATLTVGRGPLAYSYENIALVMEPDGDPGSSQSDTAFVTVYFQQPGSTVAFVAPKENFAVNAASDSVRTVLANLTLGGDADPQRTKTVGVEYRRAGTSDWLLAFEATRADVVAFHGGTTATPAMTSFIRTWTMPRDAADGAYELRAYTRAETRATNGIYTQATDRVFSDVLPGRVDRTRPTVFGTPEPADAALALGDGVRASFSEALDCQSLFEGPVTNVVRPPRVRLTTASGAAVAFVAQCRERDVQVLPDVAALGALEGQTLRVRLWGVADAAGNAVADTVRWSFVVQRSAFAFAESNPSARQDIGASTVVEARLVNGGAVAASYTLEGVAPWLRPLVAPTSLPPGGAQTLRFRTDSTLVRGTYRDTLTARSDRGDRAMLFVTLSVGTAAPDWRVAGTYANTMTVVARYYEPATLPATIGPVSSDTMDVIAAFIGAELRGVGRLRRPDGSGGFVADLSIGHSSATGGVLSSASSTPARAASSPA